MLFKDSKEPGKKKSKSKKMDANAEAKCPLCLETLEADDVNFFPCKCEYQVCRFCWHRIRTNENGLCPACRRQYTEDPANFKPITQEELQKIKNQKKLKDQQKKQKISENRKQLADLRIIQKNLVFVHGLPAGIKSDHTKQEKFIEPYKSFGKIVKSIYNERPNNTGTQILSCAYITYEKVESALRVLKSNLVNIKFEGKEVKSSLGTTKYCSNYLKNVHCPKSDCMYLHELADDEACFTKEDIKAGKHIEYGEKLYQQMVTSVLQKQAQLSHQAEQQQCEQRAENSKNGPIQDQTKPMEESYSSNSFTEPNSSPLHTPSSQPLYNRHSNYIVPLPNGDLHQYHHDPGSSSGSRINTPEREQQHFSQLQQQSSPSQNSPNCIQMNSLSKDLNDLHIESMPPEDGWHNLISKAIGPSSSLYSNHSHQNISDQRIANGIDSLLGSDQSLSPLINGLSSLYNYGSSNSTQFSESLQPNHDDDLGFDPCQLSLEGLKDLISSEADRDLPRMAPGEFSSGLFGGPKAGPQIGQQALNALFQRSLQPQKSHGNPPPGFSTFNNTTPLSSPASFERNSLPNRIPSVDLLNSTIGSSPRQSIQMSPRFQSTGLQSINSLINGSLQNPVRNLPIRQLFDQKNRAMSPNPHMMRNFGNFSPNNFQNSEQNSSPPFWNMNQQQWKPTENIYQNQRISDLGSSSPVNLRRQQQLRSSELARHAKYFSPFSSDNPQTLFPNLLNQDPKGLHTFP